MEKQWEFLVSLDLIIKGKLHTMWRIFLNRPRRSIEVVILLINFFRSHKDLYLSSLIRQAYRFEYDMYHGHFTSHVDVMYSKTYYLY